MFAMCPVISRFAFMSTLPWSRLSEDKHSRTYVIKNKCMFCGKLSKCMHGGLAVCGEAID